MGSGELLTIVLFFVYSWGFGYFVTRFTKFEADFYEKNIMRIGLGLAVFIVLATVLTFLHIPLDWRIFLLLSLSCPVFDAIQLKRQKRSINLSGLKKIPLSLFLVFTIFFAVLFMYEKGAFGYPWLEDDDSWNHAFGAKYVSREKNAFEPIEGRNTFQYLDAYPPGYDILIGILHQTSPSINWTLKFFNSLIISLSILFFFFFTKNFMRSTNKALLATFILAAVPAYMSHFIWAHVFIPPFIFILFYALEHLKTNRDWLIPSIFIFAAISLIQPTQPLKIGGLFLIYFVINWISRKKFLTTILIAGIIGFILAFAVWWGPMILQYGGVSDLLVSGLGQDSSGDNSGKSSFLKIAGTADRPYTFSDFFVATPDNMINNPVGIGLMVSILALIGLIYVLLRYKHLFVEKKLYLIIALFWFIFTLLGVQGARLPVQFIAFRFWMLFAIPVAILASEGGFVLFSFFKSLKVPRWAVLLPLLLLIILTSAAQKYELNTRVWMSPNIIPQDSLQGRGYAWLNTIPSGTKVFMFSPTHTTRIIGFDKFSCDWCQDVIAFRDSSINKTAAELASWLKKENYEYVIFDYLTFQHYGANETQSKLDEVIDSGNFEPVHQTNLMIVLKVK